MSESKENNNSGRDLIAKCIEKVDVPELPVKCACKVRDLDEGVIDNPSQRILRIGSCNLQIFKNSSCRTKDRSSLKSWYQ